MFQFQARRGANGSPRQEEPEPEDGFFFEHNEELLEGVRRMFRTIAPTRQPREEWLRLISLPFDKSSMEKLVLRALLRTDNFAAALAFAAEAGLELSECPEYVLTLKIEQVCRMITLGQFDEALELIEKASPDLILDLETLRCVSSKEPDSEACLRLLEKLEDQGSESFDRVEELIGSALVGKGNNRLMELIRPKIVEHFLKFANLPAKGKVESLLSLIYPLQEMFREPYNYPLLTEGPFDASADIFI